MAAAAGEGRREAAGVRSGWVVGRVLGGEVVARRVGRRGEAVGGGRGGVAVRCWVARHVMGRGRRRRGRRRQWWRDDGSGVGGGRVGGGGWSGGGGGGAMEGGCAHEPRTTKRKKPIAIGPRGSLFLRRCKQTAARRVSAWRVSRNRNRTDQAN
jgi:hypothetical protein